LVARSQLMRTLSKFETSNSVGRRCGPTLPRLRSRCRSSGAGLWKRVRRVGLGMVNNRTERSAQPSTTLTTRHSLLPTPLRWRSGRLGETPLRLSKLRRSFEDCSGLLFRWSSELTITPHLQRGEMLPWDPCTVVAKPVVRHALQNGAWYLGYSPTLQMWWRFW